MERWSWLLPIFRVEQDYKVALTAYYLALHVLELAHIIAIAEANELKKRRLDVPVCFLKMPKDILDTAYRLFLRSNPGIIWKTLNVSDEAMKKHWSSWIVRTHEWLGNVYRFDLPRRSVHRDFFDQL